MAKPKIKERIARLRRVYPKRDDATGLLYRTAGDRQKKVKKITVYGLFVSDDGTFLLRPHVFRNKTALGAAGWFDYLAGKYVEILRKYILSGIESRTGGTQSWRLYRIIGWVQGDTSEQSSNSKVSNRRNKTKPKRGTHGQSNLRRGQRNRKGKTK